MNAIVDQILFEASATKRIALAIFVRYGEPVGAGTEVYGLNAARFFHGILTGAGVESSPFMLSYAADGAVVFLAVNDEDKALAELWGAFSRFGCEDTSWIARHQPEAWVDIFPHTTRGAARTIPAEIVLLPRRAYELDAMLKEARAKQEELSHKLRQNRGALENGRGIDAVVSIDALDVEIAHWKEKMEAIEAEMAALKIEALGLKGVS